MESEVVDTTVLGSEWRNHEVAERVTFSTSQFQLESQPSLRAGRLEIRPIEGRTSPSAVEVLIAGVKQVGVRRLQLNIGIDEATMLIIEQVLTTERVLEVPR